MAFTRPQQKLAFDHVLNDVLDRDDSSGLKTSLQDNGINDILSLLGIDNFTVDNLTYERSPTEPYHPVNRGDKGLEKLSQKDASLETPNHKIHS